MKKFANLIVVDLGFGHIRKAGLVGTVVGHQGFHLHAFRSAGTGLNVPLDGVV